jgi:hypothetical protein
MSNGLDLTEPRWYLLIHQLPPKPLYLRAKIRQRLERVGAIALKNSVYVLPRTDDGLEDLQWIAQEAATGGGEAWVCQADFTFGADNEELVDRFRRARTVDFEALASEIRTALKAAGPRRRKSQLPEDLTTRVARFKKRLEELAGIDFFDTPARHEAEMALRSLEERIGPPRTSEPSVEARTARDRLVGRTWVTRTGVQADRIASAWLIRRFIDPEARFRFVPAGAKEHDPEEIRFDMVGGNYTHEGDRCTFETLLARFGMTDPALSQIAKVVHDIDLKDGKYGRADAPGVQQLILGLVLAHPDDDARLERGLALYDDLYRSFSKNVGASGAGRARGTSKARE